MTSRKRPRVSIVTGIVNKTSNGLTKIFNKPKTAATIRAVIKLSTVTPGRKCASTNTNTVVKNKLISVFM